MPPLKKRATWKQIEARATELKQQGKNYPDAVDIIEAETGKQFSETEKGPIRSPYLDEYHQSLREREQQKPELSSEPAQCPEYNDALRQERAPDISRPEEGPERGETQQSFPENWEERMRQIAKEVFQEMIQNMPAVGNIITDTQDIPPAPETLKREGKGRRENRDYQKVSITIDTVLWDKIMQEKDRMRVSTGRAMDIVLWRYFGKPLLSFQLPESERKALEVKYPKPKKKQR
ncbi:MAG: hypothetical protein ACLP5H_19495 [Desulfomonilaceae bacterium]